MNQCKIMYILEDSRYGGINHLVIELASELKTRNISTFILVAEKNSSFLQKKLKVKNLSFAAVQLTSLSKGFISISKYLLTFLPDIVRIIYRIKLQKPEIIYCNGSQQIKGVIAAVILRKKIVWHIHDTYQPALLLKVFNFVRVIFRIKHFIASSKRTCQFYGLNMVTTHISTPPVNSLEFNFIPREFPAKDLYRVLTVCNVNTDKGIETLLETAHRISSTNPAFNIEFRVVGMVPETQIDYFKKLLGYAATMNIQNVAFVGQKENIQAELSQADFYLCSSNNESGPIAVFEAMSIGLPVISTNVGDLERIFSEYNCGKVMPVKDSQAIADQILSQITQPNICLQNVLNARRAIEKSIDIKICVTNQLAYFNRLYKNIKF